MTRKVVVLLYGGVVYALFLVVFLYAIGFVGDIAVPKGMNDGAAGPWGIALAVNAALLGVFAGQHSIMARPAFERWWTRIVPPAAERTTFVLAATAALALLMWQWRPLPAARDMTVGRLLFAAGATGYIAVAVRLEEHDLRASLGETCERYMRSVPRSVPRFARRPRVAVERQPEPSPAAR